MACSAVVMELPNGVFITITPAAVAARMSDIVDADAGAAHHLRASSPPSDTSAVSLVAERMAMPSYSIDDLDQLFPGQAGLRCRHATPRSLKMATAAGDSLSAIRTLGMGYPSQKIS